jgi:hypothetical protein
MLTQGVGKGSTVLLTILVSTASGGHHDIKVAIWSRQSIIAIRANHLATSGVIDMG